MTFWGSPLEWYMQYPIALPWLLLDHIHNMFVFAFSYMENKNEKTKIATLKG
jgi:hypothetical protein